METPRKTWTDARLDDLSKKVDDGFDEVEQRFAKLDAKYDWLMLSLLAGALLGVIGAMIAANAG